MSNFFLSFMITSLAGFSTMLGTLIIFFKNKNRKKIISYSLIFSSSIMLYISIFDLIPSSFTYLIKIYNPIVSLTLLAIYVLFGALLVKTINKNIKNNDNNLYKVGIISMLALIIHNIPEGIITFLTSTRDLRIGIPLSISIALHNIPEGISIFVPIYYSSNNLLKAFFYTFIAAFSELLGALISYLFFYRIANDYFFSFILSITSGIMISLTIKDIIPESIKYNKSYKLIVYFVLGIIVMLLSEIII